MLAQMKLWRKDVAKNGTAVHRNVIRLTESDEPSFPVCVVVRGCSPMTASPFWIADLPKAIKLVEAERVGFYTGCEKEFAQARGRTEPHGASDERATSMNQMPNGRSTDSSLNNATYQSWRLLLPFERYFQGCAEGRLPLEESEATMDSRRETEPL